MDAPTHAQRPRHDDKGEQSLTVEPVQKLAARFKVRPEMIIE
jgi:hypothetical protein